MALWLVHRWTSDTWDHSGHAGYDPSTRTCRLNLDEQPAPGVQATGMWAGNVGNVWLEDDGRPFAGPDDPVALWLVHRGAKGSDKWAKLHGGFDVERGEHRINLDERPSPTIMAEGLCGVPHAWHWLEEDDVSATRVIYDPQAGATFDNPAKDVTDTPCVPITVGGLISNAYHFTVEHDPVAGAPPELALGGKPPYGVPLMEHLEQVPSTGLKVASTFSGTGGSCLGYRLAGFDVLWANEFVPAAQDSYRANFPATILDGRDIRTVRPEDVLEQLGLEQGELDLFDGSPPCQSFSTAGKRQKGWGKVQAHGDGSTQRSDDLFFEYSRLLEGLQPRAFIAENVSGLVKGAAKGYFLEILARLKGCGYRVEAALVDAQWCGVPQQRVRLIFQGMRDDLGIDPVFPAPLPWRYTVREALWDLTPGLVGQVVGNDAFEPVFGGTDQPHPTVMAGGARTSGFVEVQTPASAGDRGGRDLTDEPAPTIGTSGIGTGRGLDVVAVEPEAWFRGKSGEVVDRLQPGMTGADLEGGSYFSMRRLEWDGVAGTVQASEAKMPSTNQVHPVERRRLSIAELRRICSFPDDFVLTGSYSDQWARLGNSVPPLMMARVAGAVRDALLEHDEAAPLA